MRLFVFQSIDWTGSSLLSYFPWNISTLISEAESRVRPRQGLSYLRSSSPWPSLSTPPATAHTPRCTPPGRQFQHPHDEDDNYDDNDDDDVNNVDDYDDNDDDDDDDDEDNDDNNNVDDYDDNDDDDDDDDETVSSWLLLQ